MNALQLYELDNMEATFDENESALPSDIDEEKVAQELRERFRIKDLGAANWAFRKIKAMQEKRAENNALAEQEKARIDTWLEGQNRDSDKRIAFFESLILDYFLEERAKDERFKLSTPYGKVSTRKGDKWEYDEAALVESLKDAELHEFIKVVESPEKAAIKKAKDIFSVTEDGQLVTAQGEIIEGVTVVKSETITVKAE